MNLRFYVIWQEIRTLPNPVIQDEITYFDHVFVVNDIPVLQMKKEFRNFYLS